jgi:hypothetical protein
MSSSTSTSKPVSIFLTLNRQTITGYFNDHDPAPIYMRQISHELEQYIMDSAEPAKRYSAIFYKLKCTSEVDKQYAEPLIYAIRRHFTEKKLIREKDFERFKKRTWMLLAISLAAVKINFYLPSPVAWRSLAGYCYGGLLTSCCFTGIRT